MLKTNIIACLCILLIAACKNNTASNESATKDTVTREPMDSSTNMKHIVFFGNSLTAGYGVEELEAFPALIQLKIDSLHLSYRVVNAGVSGETTAGGKSRIGWIMRQPISIFILELGGNDGLRGIPLTETKRNLQFIIDTLKEKMPAIQVVLAGMRVPPNMGQKYADEFQAVFRELADKNKLAFIPFLLEGVGGITELNQADGIHPTAEGHKIVAENVWKVLKDVLQKDAITKNVTSTTNPAL